MLGQAWGGGTGSPTRRPVKPPGRPHARFLPLPTRARRPRECPRSPRETARQGSTPLRPTPQRRLPHKRRNGSWGSLSGARSCPRSQPFAVLPTPAGCPVQTAPAAAKLEGCCAVSTTTAHWHLEGLGTVVGRQGPAAALRARLGPAAGAETGAGGRGPPGAG